MADTERGRLACLYEGEQYLASVPAVCANCGARIAYDPQGLDIAKFQHPGVKFDLWCIGCAGATFKLTDKDMRNIRAWVRMHPLLAPFADRFTDDELRRVLSERAKQ